jgi:hypothetical protein
MPVGPIAKIAVLRRGLAGARPSITRSTRALGLGRTLFKEGGGSATQQASETRTGKLNGAYLLRTRGPCRSFGGRGNGPGVAEWVGAG